MNDERKREWSWWVGVGMIAVGVLLRIMRWGQGRSLWLDEILLAKNLVGRSFLGLLRPLDYRQGAPVGFLWAEKLGICIWGNSERGMRVVPLLAGCAALWVMWGVAKKLIGDRGAAAAVGILAVLEPAIYYSSEVKQYSLDLLVTLIILRFYLWYGEGRGGRRGLRLLGVGIVGMLFSHPAVFVLAGMGTVMVWRKKVDGWLMAIGCIWMVIFGAEYWLFLRELHEQAGLREYWENGFMPWSVGAAGVWLGGALAGLFGDYATMWLTFPGRGDQVAPLVGFMGAVIGGVLLGRKSLILTAPIAVCLLGALGHMYPFSGRLVLFLVPLVVLLMGGVFGNGADRKLAWAGRVLVAAVMMTSAGRAARNLVRPPGREELREVVEKLLPRVRQGDVVYVYYGARAGWEWYGPTGMQVVQGRNRDDDFRAFEKDARDLDVAGRVWVVFSHTPTGSAEDRRLAEELKGKVLEKIEAKGAGAYLYEMQ